MLLSLLLAAAGGYCGSVPLRELIWELLHPHVPGPDPWPIRVLPDPWNWAMRIGGVVIGVIAAVGANVLSGAADDRSLGHALALTPVAFLAALVVTDVVRSFRSRSAPAVTG